MRKNELLKFIPKLKEIIEESKSLHKNLLDLNVSYNFVLPSINEFAVTICENFINIYINDYGLINYDGLKNFQVIDFSIYSSEDAIAIYFNDRSATHIRFTIIFTTEGHIKFKINELYDYENNCDNIGKFIAKITADNKFKEIEVK